MPKDGGHPMPLYVWKKHSREKDREYPKVPKTWAEKCDSSYNKAVAEYRHEMLIDMLFADGVAEILKAEAEFERKVEGLARHKLPSEAKKKYNKQAVVGLKLVSGKLLNVRKPITENHKSRVPVNQDTFWIQRTA